MASKLETGTLDYFPDMNINNSSNDYHNSAALNLETYRSGKVVPVHNELSTTP
jgi:hypothetical protein